jgi:hypothetical protein
VDKFSRGRGHTLEKLFSNKGEQGSAGGDKLWDKYLVIEKINFGINENIWKKISTDNFPYIFHI